MISQEYRNNRARFPQAELVKYQGSWIAFSADGHRIVASAPTISELADQVRTAQEDMQNVVLERIEMESMEVYLGGAEFDERNGVIYG